MDRGKVREEWVQRCLALPPASGPSAEPNWGEEVSLEYESEWTLSTQQLEHWYNKWLALVLINNQEWAARQGLRDHGTRLSLAPVPWNVGRDLGYLFDEVDKRVRAINNTRCKQFSELRKQMASEAAALSDSVGVVACSDTEEPDRQAVCMILHVAPGQIIRRSDPMCPNLAKQLMQMISALADDVENGLHNLGISTEECSR